MFIPKKYGQSRIDKCPFCLRQATSINRQKVPVCAAHKAELLDGLKCVCGSVLDILSGKFGTFFSCVKCGNINMKKAMEYNDVKPKMRNQSFLEKQSKEMTVRSDDPRYFD